MYGRVGHRPARLTFTPHGENVLESFPTNIAKFTLEPGYIRPYMTHGILNGEKRT